MSNTFWEKDKLSQHCLGLIVYLFIKKKICFIIKVGLLETGRECVYAVKRGSKHAAHAAQALRWRIE